MSKNQAILVLTVKMLKINLQLSAMHSELDKPRSLRNKLNVFFFFVRGDIKGGWLLRRPSEGRELILEVLRGSHGDEVKEKERRFDRNLKGTARAISDLTDFHLKQAKANSQRR